MTKLGSTSVCKHCGERIQLINFAPGPSWTHISGGMQSRYTYCLRTAATPREVEE